MCDCNDVSPNSHFTFKLEHNNKFNSINTTLTNNNNSTQTAVNRKYITNICKIPYFNDFKISYFYNPHVFSIISQWIYFLKFSVIYLPKFWWLLQYAAILPLIWLISRIIKIKNKMLSLVTVTYNRELQWVYLGTKC